ncbi:phasin family protein [Novosphingobium sp.]|uniref:phasin family protein n=1 Tax=Novosphingobium sp. TaxID=1874826 RepID=UPI0025D480F5|nr:phasin family protein [Novosphingobium sp.]MCC6926178.1 phasin family protein [Novosphingobium sp.]
MASAPEAKIDAAAEKAYAEAAAKVEVKAAPKAEAKPVAKKAPAKQAAAKVVAKKAPVAKKAAAPKKTVKKAATKAPAKPTAIKPTTVAQFKDTIMSKTQTAAEDFTAKVKEAAADAQARAKDAFEKGQTYAAEYGEFAKGNVEALVESGKVLAAGLQDMGKDYLAEGKTALETLTADVKELAQVKSPADFFKLQGEILRRNFDAAVASGSKHSEKAVKLANDAFAPISTRVSLAVEKVKQAA